MQAKINKKEIFLLNLRFLVNKTGLNDCQIADALGIHKVSFSRYFTEQRIPKRTVLDKISEYFGVNVEKLLNEDLSAPTSSPAASQEMSSAPISSSEFEAIVRERSEELQRQVNAFVVDLLNMLPRVQR